VCYAASSPLVCAVFSRHHVLLCARCIDDTRQAAAHSTGADHIKFEGLAKRSHRSAAGLRVALDSVRSHLPLHHLTEAADEESKSVASTAAAVLPMFEAHLKEAPRGLNVRIGYARALHRAGKFVLAMRVAAEAAKMDASNTDARFILGWCQLSQGVLCHCVTCSDTPRIISGECACGERFTLLCFSLCFSLFGRTFPAGTE